MPMLPKHRFALKALAALALAAFRRDGGTGRRDSGPSTAARDCYSQ